MNRSTFNHGKSGDTNPKGLSRSPLLKLYPRSLRSEREEKIGQRASAACGGRPRLCYTLNEGKETERETTNCPPKRVRPTTVSALCLDLHRDRWIDGPSKPLKVSNAFTVPLCSGHHRQLHQAGNDVA
jgi:hypothetical protein